MAPEQSVDGPLPAFASLYRHGFVRVAAAVPRLRVGDVEHNVDATIELVRRADTGAVALVVFPELGLVGYSSQDLFHQETVLDAAHDGLDAVRSATAGLRPLVVVGAPMRVGHALFNAAVAVHDGQILGVVPKSYLPNYREFYEKRHFSAARTAVVDTVAVAGTRVPFGTDLVFVAEDLADLAVSIEICEDLWVPVPPSTFACLAGATVVVNASASNSTIAKAEYRRQLCIAQSARTFSAYVYAGAGSGESTTDLAWDGHALVAENGTLLAEGRRFAADPQLLTADVDLGRLLADRLRTTSFADSVLDHRERVASYRRVPFRLAAPTTAVPLRRAIPRFPFVPSDPAERDARCAEVYDIQRIGLASRLRATGIDKVVIGVSGGLDSTQALLVAVRCLDELGLPRSNVLAYTLPGFATSASTLRNAHALMAALGVTAGEIDIRPSALQTLRDLGHPAANGEPVYDLTYENVQAGARTSLLFRLANHHRGLVVGTGDLSELALGWSTYGVGDQMSHYGVNSSVPKTLIQYLVRWVADDVASVSSAARDVLELILATEISPELVPHATGGEQPHQRSEDFVGPYELQDFHLYHVLRFGYRPTKVAFLAHQAWGDRDRGVWPDSVAVDDRHEYDLPTICSWLREFLRRFFATSQFKRSALPDGPKVGSGGSLSPRGDWRAPSDGNAALWLAELDELMARIGDGAST